MWRLVGRMGLRPTERSRAGGQLLHCCVSVSLGRLPGGGAVGPVCVSELLPWHLGLSVCFGSPCGLWGWWGLSLGYPAVGLAPAGHTVMGSAVPWAPCFSDSRPPTGRTVVKPVVARDSEDSQEEFPAPWELMLGATETAEQEALLQRKSARRCVKQRPSYDIFESTDDSDAEPRPGSTTPRRKPSRDSGEPLCWDLRPPCT